MADSSAAASRPIFDEFQIDITELAGRAALDLVASDVGHEIGHTLSFLRCLARSTSVASALTGEDLLRARNEVERLELMLRHLRRLTLPQPSVEPIAVRSILSRAEVDLAELIEEKQISISVGLPERSMLFAESHLLYIVLRDMLKAVVQDTMRVSTVEVGMVSPTKESDGALEVRGRVDPDAPPRDSDVLDLWATTHGHPPALGLPSAARIARLFGWTLSMMDHNGCCGLRLEIPATSFPSEPAR